MNQKRMILVILLLVGFVSVITACNFPYAQPTEPVKELVEPPTEVDHLFLDLYILLGGVETFGRPISETVWEDTYSCQTMMNAKFCYDASKEGVDAYFLAPIVRDSNLVPNDCNELPAQQGEKQVNGYTILPEFVPLFEQLYGTVFTGQPLSEATINYEKSRIEQYFETVIFARDLAEEIDPPYLLPAGYATCTENCSTDMTVELPIPIRNPKTSPFSALLGPIHGEDFGSPLTRPFLNQAGQMVQIFENVVVVSPPENFEAAQLMPLSKEMGMFEMDPVTPKLSDTESLTFYPTQENGNGFHVPLLFDEFVSQHGGRNTSGNPLAEVAYYEDATIRQCFETYCLDYVEHNGVYEVKMAPLGSKYLDRQLSDGLVSPEVLLQKWITLDDINITVGEQMEILPLETEQYIIVSVQDRQNGKSVPGIRGQVYLQLPDQAMLILTLPETNAGGVSYVTIPAEYAVQAGDLFRYELCLNLLSGEESCTTGAYVVHEISTP